MATYELNFIQTAGTTIKVEADTLEDAIDEAYQEGFPDVCAHCAGVATDRPGIDLSGDWDLDETSYYRDGEYIEGMEEEA